MAKDITTDIDTVDLLNSFEEECVPKLRKAKSSEKQEPKPTAKVAHDKRDLIAKQPAEVEHSDDESAYLKIFVESCPISSFYKQGRQVVVVNEHRKKIQKILALFGEDANIAGYVYNVLEQHFREYDKIIQSLYSKCRQI